MKKTGVVTIKEIAEALHVHRTNAARRALEENWPHEEKAGRGGKAKLYPIATLPAPIQQALIERESEAIVTRHEAAAALRDAGPLAVIDDEPVDLRALKGWQRQIFEARLALWREFERLQGAHGTTRAVAILETMAKREALPAHLQACVDAANARKGDGRTLSRSTILGWQRAVRRGGIAALAPKGLERGEIPAWAPYFLKCYQLPTNPSLAQALDEMARILPDDIPLPSYHQVVRFHHRRSRLDRERGRKTGSDWRSLQGYRQRDTSEFRPLDIGVCDGHSFKARVAHPVHGKPFKPEVCAVIDAATRVVVGWSAGLAESAMTVADAVRHAATTHEHKPFGGVFNVLYTDGGAGNTAKINADEVAGLFARIGTTHATGIPGNAQGRGLIERLNASLWIRAAKALPTFVGKDMDGLTKRNVYLVVEKDVRTKGTSALLMTWPQFLGFCEAAVAEYNRRPHSSLPKITDPETKLRRHMSPLECWAWHMANGWNQAACQLSAQEIEVLWRPRIERTVVRSCVELGGNTYFNKDLAHLDGERVQVGYDQHAPESVQIWNGHDQLVCYAYFEKNRTSYFPVAMVERAAEERARRRSQIKRNQLDEIDQERRGVIEARRGEVIPMAPLPEHTIDRQQLAERMQAPAEFEVPHDDRGKYRLWQDLERRVLAGETLDERAVRFFEAYRKTASWQAFRGVEERLGAGQAAPAGV